MARLMAALQDKTLSDNSPSSNFRKRAILVLAPADELNYREWQWNQFVRVSGLQKLTQKIELCLQLEMVDVRLCFELNCIKTNILAINYHIYSNKSRTPNSSRPRTAAARGAQRKK